jgi:hypothetical protein
MSSNNFSIDLRVKLSKYNIYQLSKAFEIAPEIVYERIGQHLRPHYRAELLDELRNAPDRNGNYRFNDQAHAAAFFAELSTRGELLSPKEYRARKLLGPVYYERTGALEAGWDVRVRRGYDRSTLLFVENDYEDAGYVMGDPVDDGIIPSQTLPHASTGWLLAGHIVSAHETAINLEINDILNEIITGESRGSDGI